MQILRRLTAESGKHNLSRRMFWARSKPAPKYEVRLALPEDREKIMNFLAHTYLTSEPSIVNLGGLSVEQNPLLLRLMYMSVREGWTIITENRDTNCVVGAAVNVESRPSDVERIESLARCAAGLSDRARKLLGFYAACSRQADVWATYDYPPVFECAYLSVHPEHQRRGIAKRLIQESWALARDLACQTFRIDCTSRWTAQIAEEFGWRCLHSQPYSRHPVAGEPVVFEYIQEPHEEMRIYANRLNDYKNYYPKSRARSRRDKQRG